MKLFALRRPFILLALMVGMLAFVAPAAATDPVPWGYEGDIGAEHWGELSPDYALCATGTEQSPVDIPSTAPLNPGLAYAYQPSALNILNNGHTVQVNYDPGSTMQLEGSTYELVQFHFHARSENTLDGQPTPLELHLVHRNAEGKLAVVGVWLTSGAENAAFSSVMDNLPASESAVATVAGETVNADALLPAERTYYRYNGSLTTPPCSEGVKWVMLGSSVELSADQIGSFTSLFANDFRPTQPLQARTFLAPGETAPASGGLPSAGGSSPAPAFLIVGLSVALLLCGLWLRRRPAQI